MRALRMLLLAAVVLLMSSWSEAQAGGRWGGGRGGGPYYGGYYRPYYRPYYGYPGIGVIVAPGVVVGAAPLIVQPAPVVVEQPPVVVVSPALPVPQEPQVAPPVGGSTEPPPIPSAELDGTEQLFRQLNHPSAQVRAEAAIQLGRRRILTAASPLSRMLASDGSPQAREAAARALGLIGSSQALTALQTAAQADDDRDVRHSAQFAAEVIRSNLRR